MASQRSSCLATTQRRWWSSPAASTRSAWRSSGASRRLCVSRGGGHRRSRSSSRSSVKTRWACCRPTWSLWTQRPAFSGTPSRWRRTRGPPHHGAPRRSPRWWREPDAELAGPQPGVRALHVLGRAGLARKAAAAGALARAGGAEPPALYVCELRWRDPQPRPDTGEPSTSCCLRHCRDALGGLEAWFPRWSCDDDGLFVGGRGAGKGLHVDQRPESNVGKNWRGYKLFAVWPDGAVGDAVLREFYGEVFQYPLSGRHLRALEKAARVVLLRPGDVFFFHGGLPHTTLCVSQGLGVTGYEGFLSLNARHTALFLRSCAEFSGDWSRVASAWRAEVGGALAAIVADPPSAGCAGLRCRILGALEASSAALRDDGLGGSPPLAARAGAPRARGGRAVARGLRQAPGEDR
ncbi:unnamed protein product [Prorocentrum cordatum]|uniref:Bifunctional lysine-specific demethylase and histidyl-hydroxylase n=1 Tax=Prorocentrum cordatum TaxID=2364126 RepID=A0ABN9U9U5_9DINO|nr:unnamed protein product [Polarella glacialis]